MAEFRAKKALGQNFINDPQIIEAIVDACGAGPEDTVVEIGPGKGALTCTLAERAKRVVAVELDSSVIPLLKGNLAGAPNVEVVNEDILKFDWSRVPGGVLRIVGNLPYYITTPILLGILEKNVPAESITVMVQKEVAERICAGPGGKDYGVLSISLQYYADCAYVLDVPAEYFTPRPKVDSAVVHMTLKKERLLAPQEEPQFFALVKKAFSQRRKTLLNSLAGYCPAPGAAPLQKEDILKALAATGIDEKRRPETLSIEEFATLSRALI
jgi:16S rRNA (adenine1518-N6/adenine1519-N6)-dimethyltransferase